MPVAHLSPADMAKYDSQVLAGCSVSCMVWLLLDNDGIADTTVIKEWTRPAAHLPPICLIKEFICNMSSSQG